MNKFLVILGSAIIAGFGISYGMLPTHLQTVAASWWCVSAMAVGLSISFYGCWLDSKNIT